MKTVVLGILPVFLLMLDGCSGEDRRTTTCSVGPYGVGRLHSGSPNVLSVVLAEGESIVTQQVRLMYVACVPYGWTGRSAVEELSARTRVHQRCEDDYRVLMERMNAVSLVLARDTTNSVPDENGSVSVIDAIVFPSTAPEMCIPANGVSLSEYLIRSGDAWYDSESETAPEPYDHLLRQAQADAILARAGIWGEPMMGIWQTECR